VHLDHVQLVDEDLAWLQSATQVRAWAVKTPDGFWSRLPNLEWLTITGGTGHDTDVVRGCHRLRWLEINQVRGVESLDALLDLSGLEFLSLYGLPRVRSMPSLASLKRLRYAVVGSMKGLTSIAGLMDAPNLQELTLLRAVGLDAADAALIAQHPSLRAFEWFAEDVPDRTWVPVVNAVDKAKPTVNGLTWPLPNAG
jgi:hypothetical protein